MFYVVAGERLGAFTDFKKPLALVRAVVVVVFFEAFLVFHHSFRFSPELPKATAIPVATLLSRFLLLEVFF
jgi:hypothetical protein